MAETTIANSDNSKLYPVEQIAELMSKSQVMRHKRNRTTAVHHSFESFTGGTESSKILNSHVPAKAIDYLQLVDDPKISKVVQ